jgi:NADPH-dependent glutamate synthase beta subunit-like oxidoreductase/NAD-dependent dihydropyrimidine dehydrogenase PreA subunit
VNNGALIIGASEAGLQAALDLADSGIPVHLTTSAHFFDNAAAQPVSSYQMNVRALEVLRHPFVQVWTNTEVQELESDASGFRVNLRQRPRYVDLDRCIVCGDCTDVCPVTVPGTDRKAIFLDGQPGCMAIDRPGKAPCSGTCPGGIHVQGYVALIAQGRYQEAIELIRDAIPFPSVCGRVCNHDCETNCTRGKVDAALNIMALKRFVADWAYEHRDSLVPHTEKSGIDNTKPLDKKIAIIGAGPSGLTAARDLVRLGYTVTVFDALPNAGGMMRFGIPPHRLPTEKLDWEIQQIVAEGVELKLDTWVNDIPGLIKQGYDAVLIATGAHRAKKISLRNSNHPDNWLSLDLLRGARQGEEIDLNGKKVTVLGGGNGALDTARTAIRLGADQVRMACLETRGEMPGFDWEIGVAEEEGIKMCPGRTFKEIVVENNQIVGVRCMEIDFRGFQQGRPDFDEIPGTEHILPADIVIWAIGQEPNFSFLPHDGSIDTRFPFGIRSDENMMTTLAGVFVSGDVRRGKTFFVIDAIGEGRKAARSIDRYLRGDKAPQEPIPIPNVEFDSDKSRIRFKQSKASGRLRAQIPSLPLEERIGNFNEVDLTLSEEDALTEASRCLLCGPCSECLACVNVCKTGAIDHNQSEISQKFSVNAVIYAGRADEIAQVPFVESQHTFHVEPDDALLGSAVAFQAIQNAISARQQLPISVAPEFDGTPGRIGVFICQCGDEPASGKISAIVNTKTIQEHVSAEPDVLHAQVLPFSCTPIAAQTISTAVEAHALDRVVLAACSCCNIDQVCLSCTYQRVRSKDNLNLLKFAENNMRGTRLSITTAQFEFVNIREQCALVHHTDPPKATAKAATLVKAAIARAKSAPAKLAGARTIDKSAVVLGKGPAASLCENALRQLGVTVQHVDTHPDQIQRCGGLYTIHQDDLTWQASALVLSPTCKEEFEKQLTAFGRLRRRPQIQVAWGGLDTHRPGVFYIDPETNPPAAGAAAAARVFAWIGRSESRPPTAAIVDPDRCRACETCIDTCEYGAPELIEINERITSWIDPAICVSCGTCAARCPSGAISAGCSTDTQLEAMLDAILI